MVTEIDKRAQIICAERKGHNKGLMEGKAEALLQTARNMRKADIADEIICPCTGLTMEQVIDL